MSVLRNQELNNIRIQTTLDDDIKFQQSDFVRQMKI